MVFVFQVSGLKQGPVEQPLLVVLGEKRFANVMFSGSVQIAIAKGENETNVLPARPNNITKTEFDKIRDEVKKQGKDLVVLTNGKELIIVVKNSEEGKGYTQFMGFKEVPAAKVKFIGEVPKEQVEKIAPAFLGNEIKETSMELVSERKYSRPFADVQKTRISAGVDAAVCSIKHTNGEDGISLRVESGNLVIASGGGDAIQVQLSGGYRVESSANGDTLNFFGNTEKISISLNKNQTDFEIKKSEIK